VWNAVSLLCFQCAVLVGCSLALAATPRTLVATIQRVSDGDTVIALTADGTNLRIGLLGIGVPAEGNLI
jgi:hypothetical protein